VLDIRSSKSTLVTNEEKTSEPHWLENDILYLKEDKNSTQLIVVDINDFNKTYTAGTVPASISDVKLKVLDKGKVALVFSAKANADGGLYNPQDAPKKYHTGRLYDSLMVRHWDTYITPNTNALWYGVLRTSKLHVTESKGRYNLSRLTNALKDTHLESPIAPFPSSSHYDIGANGIAFVAKDPDINPAINTKCNFYYLPISDFTAATSGKPRFIGKVNGLNGAAASPVLSPDGRGAAFLKMKLNGYESDKNRIILIPDLSDLGTTAEVYQSDDGKGSWDRSPSELQWSSDGKALYILAEDEGKEVLFKADIRDNPKDIKMPENVASAGSVTYVKPLSSSSTHLLLSGSSLVDNSIYSTVDPADPTSLKVISSNSHNGASFGLSLSQVSSIWFPGASAKTKVHAWVIRPSNFSESTKYPLAYLIHGGPQGAWTDSWSTRWNPAVFAEQGYVVVTPNPTGSTSYGQAFTDAIQNQWGGLPYEDLVNGFNYIRDNIKYVDISRSVALGASYGGFMMNWINGRPLGREFKALVCHDGVFSIMNQMSSDEQYFPNHELGGPFWKNTAAWDKWDPARHTGEWKTPTLIIHNELDYRLPISEGLAAFNVLQQRGVESRFLSFPDENHWVLKEENSLVWHRVVLGWINKFVGLPDPEGPEVEVQNPAWAKKGARAL
jgi:dipeptidyl aminopeptidase/acylaminoacyl peptidase